MTCLWCCMEMSATISVKEERKTTFGLFLLVLVCREFMFYFLSVYLDVYSYQTQFPYQMMIQTERRFSLFLHGNCSGHLHTEPKTCHWTKRTTKSPLNSKYCVNHICVSRLYTMPCFIFYLYILTYTVIKHSFLIRWWSYRIMITRQVLQVEQELLYHFGTAYHFSDDGMS
jgi:hypothetical protein